MGASNEGGLTDSERAQIAEILNRRANEIAGFAGDYRNKAEHYGSVELALTREMDRLRRLSDKVAPKVIEEE